MRYISKKVPIFEPEKRIVMNRSFIRRQYLIPEDNLFIYCINIRI